MELAEARSGAGWYSLSKSKALLVQARLSSGDDIFGPLITKFLLNNKHKVCMLYSTKPASRAHCCCIS
jgi:hypothetical protein